MYEQTVADKIWNRACLAREEALRAGDSALKALLRFHGVAMNGGVLHSVEFWSPEELATAQDGYRYFGFKVIAELISAAQEALCQGQDSEPLEEILEHEYTAEIPDDETLAKVFEAHYKRSPESYAPLAGD